MSLSDTTGTALGITPANISAIVVSHRSAQTIDDCLQRLRDSAAVKEIRVVDNASDDDTVEVVQRHASADSRVRFIANPDNPGFAVACNQGVSDSTASWLAFVNPDCLVEPETLSRLLALAGNRTCLLGADLVDEAGVRDAAARRNDPDFGAMLGSVLPGLPRARSGNPGRRPGMAIEPDDGLELQPVDAVSGALMLMPRALFTRIGGFDEGYRLHAEDLDLCRRAREAGAFVAVANAVRVLHVRGVSSRRRPLFVEWHKHRGLWRYFSKFEAARRGPLMRATVLVAIWLRFPFAVVRAGLASLRA